jgi:N-acyl-D-aspartate/D-glutamate deacylase
MHDVIIKGGSVVDGTGSEAFAADVGIVQGKIAEIAPSITAEARLVLDADGLVVCPGFIDLHTHYDAQLLWDPAASPSPLHGVTTILGGNCGFGIAPMSPSDVSYLQEMMATVEGMPLAALRGGPAWDWTSFGEWLDRLEGQVAVNAGFLVGHSTIRRMVMGDASTVRRASDDEIASMVELLRSSLAEGAVGFSSSKGPHHDAAGDPVPSRFAEGDEILALCAVVSDFEGTTLEFIPGMGEISPASAQLMADMSLAGNRPLNWNLLGNLSPTPIYEQQLAASDVASAQGAMVVALTLPDLMRLRSDQIFASLPEWKEFMARSVPERVVAGQDPDVRRRLKMAAAAIAERGLGAAASWDLIEIASDEPADGRDQVGATVASLARGSQVDPIDIVIDALSQGLHLQLVFPSLEPDLGASDEGWRARAAVWLDERALIGGSDAGAHLDVMCHANYTTVVLGEAVRRRKVISLEEAIHQMTQRPAELYGLRGRGILSVGSAADVVVFDPETVDSTPTSQRHDLPGGEPRLYAEAVGVDYVLVNGEVIVDHGSLSGRTPGTVLRSGVDTYSVTL